MEQKNFTFEDLKEILKPKFEDWKTIPPPEGLKEITKDIMMPDILIEICKIKKGFVDFREIYKIYDKFYEESIITLEDCVSVLKEIDKYIQITGIRNSFTSICVEWSTIRGQLKVKESYQPDSTNVFKSSQTTNFNQVFSQNSQISIVQPILTILDDPKELNDLIEQKQAKVDEVLFKWGLKVHKDLCCFSVKKDFTINCEACNGGVGVKVDKSDPNFGNMLNHCCFPKHKTKFILYVENHPKNSSKLFKTTEHPIDPKTNKERIVTKMVPKKRIFDGLINDESFESSQWEEIIIEHLQPNKLSQALLKALSECVNFSESKKDPMLILALANHFVAPSRKRYSPQAIFISQLLLRSSKKAYEYLVQNSVNIFPSSTYLQKIKINYFPFPGFDKCELILKEGYKYYQRKGIKLVGLWIDATFTDHSIEIDSNSGYTYGFTKVFKGIEIPEDALKANQILIAAIFPIQIGMSMEKLKPFVIAWEPLSGNPTASEFKEMKNKILYIAFKLDIPLVLSSVDNAAQQRAIVKDEIHYKNELNNTQNISLNHPCDLKYSAQVKNINNSFYLIITIQDMRHMVRKIVSVIFKGNSIFRIGNEQGFIDLFFQMVEDKVPGMYLTYLLENSYNIQNHKRTEFVISPICLEYLKSHRGNVMHVYLNYTKKFYDIIYDHSLKPVQRIEYIFECQHFFTYFYCFNINNENETLSKETLSAINQFCIGMILFFKYLRDYHSDSHCFIGACTEFGWENIFGFCRFIALDASPSILEFIRFLSVYNDELIKQGQDEIASFKNEKMKTKDQFLNILIPSDQEMKKIYNDKNEIVKNFLKSNFNGIDLFFEAYPDWNSAYENKPIKVSLERKNEILRVSKKRDIDIVENLSDVIEMEEKSKITSKWRKFQQFLDSKYNTGKMNLNKERYSRVLSNEVYLNGELFVNHFHSFLFEPNILYIGRILHILEKGKLKENQKEKGKNSQRFKTIPNGEIKDDVEFWIAFYKIGKEKDGMVEFILSDEIKNRYNSRCLEYKFEQKNIIQNKNTFQYFIVKGELDLLYDYAKKNNYKVGDTFWKNTFKQL